MDMTFHWLFLGFSMGTHTPKKWYEGFEAPLFTRGLYLGLLAWTGKPTHPKKWFTRQVVAWQQRLVS